MKPDLPQEHLELQEARKDYDSTLKAAKKTLQESIKSWDKKIKEAEKDYEKAQFVGKGQLDRFGKIKLFEDHVETPDGTAYFENGEVKAEVEAAGNLEVAQRLTVSRMACCGCFSLAMPKRKEIDSRELFLTISAPGFGTLVQCNLPDSKKARQFAININSAYQLREEKEKAHNEAVSQSSKILQETKEERETAIQREREKFTAALQNNDRLKEAIQAAENILAGAENKKLSAEIEKAKELLRTANDKGI